MHTINSRRTFVEHPLPQVLSPAVRALLRDARRIATLSGAGISAESGIPTFRDAMTGLWERFDAEQLATPEAFERDPALGGGWYEWRRRQVARAQPNPAHRALARLEVARPGSLVVTQNVDDLHERAGGRRVVHLHGSLFTPRCFDCERPYALAAGIPDEPEGGRRLAPPACDRSAISRRKDATRSCAFLIRSRRWSWVRRSSRAVAAHNSRATPLSRAACAITALRLTTRMLESVIASAEKVCSSSTSRPKISPAR